MSSFSDSFSRNLRISPRLLLLETGGWGESGEWLGSGLEGQMSEGELEGSGGLVGHEGPGSAGGGGRMVGLGKHDATSTGGVIEGLAPRASCISW